MSDETKTVAKKKVAPTVSAQEPKKPSKPLWEAAKYGSTIHLSGALKLADSRVAPLVAIARGYSTVESAGSTDFIRNSARLEGRSAQAKQIKGLFDNSSDVLAMPWYSLSAVASFASAHARAENQTEEDWLTHLEASVPIFQRSMYQFRPAIPQVNQHGKPLKYVFLKNSNIVIDAHPSTPSGWISSADDVFVTEGVIKADSALTELLLDAGVSVEELSETPTHVEARAKLSVLMDRVPESDRVLVLAFGGVANWHNKTEWNDIVLRDRRVFVAFDGDVRSNRMVYNQARQFWDFMENKGADVNLVDLSLANANLLAQGESPKALGVDDYLSQGHGNWNDLLSLSIRELPTLTAPDDDVVVGGYRISPDGKRLEVGKENPDEYGGSSPAFWAAVPGHEIGGNIVRKITQRKPSAKERATGQVDSKVDETEAVVQVEIEVKFIGRLGDDQTAIVTGPVSILAENPADWHKPKIGATVPSELLLSAEWPPLLKGREWVQAVKSFKPEEIEEKTIWNTMGWVPTNGDGACAYIAGSRVITDEVGVISTYPGIDETVLPGASSFGVIDSYRFAPGDEERINPLPKEEIEERERQIITEVFDALIHNGPWVNSAQGAITLAAGLRPCAATRSKSSIFALGEPGSGKTWTAGQIMAFWQSRPGAWSKDSLPGSAKDTIASIEQSIAATMIWAIDDWAPSPDRGKAAEEETKMGDVVRSVFNGAGKRRATATMGTRETLNPIATLIITAENELTVSSARERTIPITFQKGSLGARDKSGEPIGLDAINSMNTVQGTSSKLSAAVIYSIIERVRTDLDRKWQALVEWEQTAYEDLKKYASDIALSLESPVDPGSANRQVEMAADICLGLMHLHMLADKLGMKDICDEIVDQRYIFGFDETHSKDTLVYKVMRLVVETYYRKENTRPGQIWVNAIRDMLAAKTGHFVSGERPDHAPFDGSNQIILNDLVGWGVPRGGGPMEPKGAVLGRIYYDKKLDETFFLLHPQNAFDAAKKNYPSLIQFGANMTTYVQNVIADPTLLSPVYSGKPGRSGGTHVVNRAFSGAHRGIPIRWEAIIDGIPMDEARVSTHRKEDEN